MFTLYTTEDKLTELCMEGGDWYDIIRNQRTIFVCNDSGEDTWDVSNEVLMNLYRGGVDIDVDNELAENIKNDNKNVLELPNPAYIMDYPEHKANEISKKYGVIFCLRKIHPSLLLPREGGRSTLLTNPRNSRGNTFLAASRQGTILW